MNQKQDREEKSFLLVHFSNDPACNVKPDNFNHTSVFRVSGHAPIMTFCEFTYPVVGTVDPTTLPTSLPTPSPILSPATAPTTSPLITPTACPAATTTSQPSLIAPTFMPTRSATSSPTNGVPDVTLFSTTASIESEEDDYERSQVIIFLFSQNNIRAMSS